MYIQTSYVLKVRFHSRPKQYEHCRSWARRIALQRICMCGNYKSKYTTFCPTCNKKHLNWCSDNNIYGFKHLYEKTKDVYSIE